MIHTHPDLADELHPTRNGEITARNTRAAITTRLWWRCKRGHEWRASGARRVRGRQGCAICRNRRVVKGVNDMATTHPNLAREMHPTMNGAVSSAHVPAGTNKLLWWRCAEGHEWRAAGSARVKGSGCSACSGKRAVTGVNDMVTTHPWLAAQWDSERNPQSSPRKLLAATSMRFWWKCERGHQRHETGIVRVRRGGCRDCPSPNEPMP